MISSASTIRATVSGQRGGTRAAVGDQSSPDVVGRPHLEPALAAPATTCPSWCAAREPLALEGRDPSAGCSTGSMRSRAAASGSSIGSMVAPAARNAERASLQPATASIEAHRRSSSSAAPGGAARPGPEPPPGRSELEQRAASAAALRVRGPILSSAVEARRRRPSATARPCSCARDATERGREADRAAGVRPDREPAQAGGDGDCRATAGAARNSWTSPSHKFHGVPRRLMMPIAPSALGGLELAEERAARPSREIDERPLRADQVIDVEPWSRRWSACRAPRDVLDAHWHAHQRAEVLAGRARWSRPGPGRAPPRRRRTDRHLASD